MEQQSTNRIIVALAAIIAIAVVGFSTLYKNTTTHATTSISTTSQTDASSTPSQTISSSPATTTNVQPVTSVS